MRASRNGRNALRGQERDERMEKGAQARAAADAAVVAGLLDQAQRRRYAGSGDEVLTAQRVATERTEVLLQAPPAERDERESAEAALAADARTQRWSGYEGSAQCGVMLVGTVFLVGGGIGLLLRSEILFVIGAISLVLAAVLLAIQFFWARRVAARRVRVLIQWASHRPGQFGRGLPLGGRTARTSLWNSDLTQKLMLIAAAAGVLMLGSAVWFMLNGSAGDGMSELLIMGAVGTGAGLLYFVGGPLAHRAAKRRDAALEWLPSSHVEGRAEGDWGDGDWDDGDWDDGDWDDGDWDEEEWDEDDADEHGAERAVGDQR